MTQEFPQYMNVKGGIEVATFEQAVQQAVGKDPVVNAFLDLPHGTDTSFSEKLKGFVSAIEKTPEEKLSIAGRFIKFTFGLKGDLDNENGTDPQPDGSDNGTLGWLREQYDLLKGFNEELIGRPLQNLIFSKKDKNGNNVIVGTYGLVKTDRGAEEKFAGVRQMQSSPTIKLAETSATKATKVFW